MCLINESLECFCRLRVGDITEGICCGLPSQEGGMRPCTGRSSFTATAPQEGLPPPHVCWGDSTAHQGGHCTLLFLLGATNRRDAEMLG